jgi:hypothetical protein
MLATGIGPADPAVAHPCLSPWATAADATGFFLLSVAISRNDSAIGRLIYCRVGPPITRLLDDGLSFRRVGAVTSTKASQATTWPKRVNVTGDL